MLPKWPVINGKRDIFGYYMKYRCGESLHMSSQQLIVVYQLLVQQSQFDVVVDVDTSKMILSRCSYEPKYNLTSSYITVRVGGSV